MQKFLPSHLCTSWPWSRPIEILAEANSSWQVDIPVGHGNSFVSLKSGRHLPDSFLGPWAPPQGSVPITLVSLLV